MTTTTPEIIEFETCRVIGMSYVGKNENKEIPALWDSENGFLRRMGEVVSPPAAKWKGTDRHPAFGICRCFPGATDGSFEYIAAVPATADAPIPEGMVEATIAAGTYAAFPVPSLDALHAAWQAVGEWQKAHPEWVGYCDNEGCDCVNHPAFELYPPDFGDQGQLFIYVPVRAGG